MEENDENRKHTLDVIVEEMKKNEKYENASIEEIDEDLYSAALISMVTSADNSTSKEVMPTPLFRINYDENNFNNIKFEELDGYAMPTEENSMDYDAIDVTIMSMLREVPILWVGGSGTGKTYTAKAFGRTIGTKEGFHYEKMSGNLGESVLDYFTKTEWSTGKPITYVDKEKTEGTMILFIDEPNRGSINENLQLLEGEVTKNGETVLIGPNIPELTDEGVKFEENRKKKTVVIGAINPDQGMLGGTTGKREKYIGTRAMDDAERRRWTSMWFPDTSSVGESINETADPMYNFPEFIENFTEKMVDYFEIDEEGKERIKENIEEDWFTIFGYITDKERTNYGKVYTAYEFSDAVSATLRGNFAENLEKENKIIDIFNTKLSSKYQGVNFNSVYNMSDKKSNLTEKLEDIVCSLQKECNGDIAKVGDVANGIKTLRDIKKSVKSGNPIETYQKINEDNGSYKSAVNIADVANAWIIVGASKGLEKESSEKISVIVNEVLNEYSGLERFYRSEVMDENVPPLEVNDVSRGIKDVATIQGINYAVKRAEKDENESKDYVNYMIQGINKKAQILEKYNSGPKEIAKLMAARYEADLATLCGFLDEYKTEINEELNSGNVDLNDATEVEKTIHKIYSKKKEEQTRGFQRVYTARMPRILGMSM